ncbi:MAG TPA: acyl-CoA dehydrogenase family protein [Acidimicrobiales bacterium]|nr:acyl-CoA dehydrogenase family protein [Acidimicrobiales bacterium]
MDFRVDDEQRALAEGIRSVLQGRLPLEHLRAREGDERTISQDDWDALGATGLFSLTLAEPAGTGLGLADAVVVFEELGRGLVPGPLVGSFLAAAAGLVPGAEVGTAQVGVHRTGPGPVLVEHLGALDALLVLGPDDEARLLAPDRLAGAVRAAAPLDPLTPVWHLASLPAGDALEADGPRLRRDGALLTAALQVGHAAEVLDLAVAYAKERHQFGKPIGTFQAVKHICADMLVRAEVARAAVHAAACLADAPDVAVAEATAAGCTRDELLERSVAGAKLLADEAALTNARAAIQVHGGMGYTWQVPVHLHLKRARVHATTFGTPADHAAALAASA